MPENDQRVDKKISTLCSSHHNRSLHLRLLQNCYQFSGTERNGGLQRLIWTYSDGPPGLLREPKLLIFGDLWSYLVILVDMQHDDRIDKARMNFVWLFPLS